MKNENNLWNKFYTSGKIDDYLKYRDACIGEDAKNASEHTRPYYPGIEHGGTKQNSNGSYE